MTEANLRRSWPSYQSHMYCLHKSGEVCTQFHMDFILLTVQHVQNASCALTSIAKDAFIGCRVQ